MALAPTPPPFPIQNSNFLEPCFTGNAALTSSANATTASGSVLASYPYSFNQKKEKIFKSLTVSSSLACALTGSNLFLALNLNTDDYFVPGGNYTQSLELQYAEATLTGSTELSLCTSFYGGPQP